MATKMQGEFPYFVSIFHKIKYQTSKLLHFFNTYNLCHVSADNCKRNVFTRKARVCEGQLPY